MTERIKISVEVSLRFQLLIDCGVITVIFIIFNSFKVKCSGTKVFLEVAGKATINAFLQSDVYGLDFFKMYMRLDKCCNSPQHP